MRSSSSSSERCSCRIFEQSVGTLLKYAVDHVEALQIMDIPELIAHCREVMMDYARVEHKDDEVDRMQETLVIHYLFCIGSKLESVSISLRACMVVCAFWCVNFFLYILFCCSCVDGRGKSHGLNGARGHHSTVR